MEELQLKEHEVSRYAVIMQTLTNGTTSAQAARMLGLSSRQVFRLKAKVRVHGQAGVVHGNRGRIPAIAKSEELHDEVVALYESDFFDFNFTHFTEVLAEKHHITISDETVRRWLRAKGLGNPGKATRRRHFRKRERRARKGELIFLDGSPHPWLGKDRPPLTLILCSDDATGEPLHGCFHSQETRNGCFEVLYRVFRRYGLPESLYIDRASQFTTTRHDGVHRHQRDDKPTAFEIAMARLAIHPIFAHTPQAKGRIERLNGSFQGRLIAELRYNNITTPEAATRYLNKTFIPNYARKFGVKPRHSVSAFRVRPKGLDLRTVLCAKTTRTVTNDNTISLNNRIFQLLPKARTRVLAQSKVEVQEWFDGSIHVFHPRAGEVRTRELSQ
ncbi:MAG: ISNCY family transposase [Chloroflexi bacterium]|nr:MAG: ISNCY family transposase [Chloroflexota bacterium]